VGVRWWAARGSNSGPIA